MRDSFLQDVLDYPDSDVPRIRYANSLRFVLPEERLASYVPLAETEKFPGAAEPYDHSPRTEGSSDE